jgi:ribonucleotide reductase alpha subunit
MCVVNRLGVREPILFDTILRRIKNLGTTQSLRINYHDLVIKVIEQMYDGIKTTQIDELTAQQCASMVTTHPDYGVLAGRIVISNLHKNTSESFASVVEQLYQFVDIRGNQSPLVSKELFDISVTNISTASAIQQRLDFTRDFEIDYFGTKTLERAYLMRVNGAIVERPQHMWMRVSLGIHGDDLDRAFETYDLMSMKYFTHATPTLFNSGTPRPQLSSCYLLGMENDSIDGIYQTLHDCGKISKWAGGIGLHIHNVRGTGSHIRGTNGTSNGIVPMLRVFNMTARYVDQCFDPETMIATPNGYERIGNISIGDSITNGAGMADTVAEVHCASYTGDMIRFDSGTHIAPTTVTTEHPFLVVRGIDEDMSDRAIQQGIVHSALHPEYIVAKELLPTDRIVSPRPTSPEKEGIVSILTNMDLYMVGLILSTGTICEETLDTTIRIYGANTNAILKRCRAHADRYCADHGGSLDPQTNTATFTWKFSSTIPISRSMIYNSNGDKHINPLFMNVSKSRLVHLLRGLVDGSDYQSIVCYESIAYCGAVKRLLDICEVADYTVHRVAGKISIGGVVTTDGVGPPTTRATDGVGATPSAIGGATPSAIGGATPSAIGGATPSAIGGATPSAIGGATPSAIGATDPSDPPSYIFTKPVRVSVIAVENKIVIDLKMSNTAEPSYVTELGVVHNGGGKRNGSFAIYLEPWHPDIMAFLELKKNHGDEEQRARDLFYAVWACDLFMKRVKANESWSLFCPDGAPGLENVHGDEFERLYELYESRGLASKTLPARDVWYAILDSQMETGTPYLLYKDAANRKSNQQNLGTIRSSNLCTEIMEYSDGKETAVCNLASVSLSAFVKHVPATTATHSNVTVYSRTTCRYCVMLKRFLGENAIPYTEITVDDDMQRHDLFAKIKRDYGTDVSTVPQITGMSDDTAIHWNGYDMFVADYTPSFDFEALHRITKVVAYNLNRVIDVNFYPTDKTRRSNLNHRPIGIGVQGLADAFAMMRFAFESPEAKQLNRDIFETIYHAAMVQSMETAKERAYDIMNTILPAYESGIWRWAAVSEQNPHDVDWEFDNMCGSNGGLMDTMTRIRPTRAEIDMAVSAGSVAGSVASAAVARVVGGPTPSVAGSYASFAGSPLSRGEFQFDLWGVEPSDRYDWPALRNEVVRWGTRNSLLMAPMPTASTSQILGNNECFEPFTSNIYTRRTLAGEFVVINRHLMRELVELGLWSVAMKDRIIRDHGSVQHISEIPADVRDRYKIVWEMSMRNIIDMAADRGAFVCQSQSMNLWVEEPNYKNLTAMHFYSWSKGLKTGQYYLRRKPKHQPQQFTIEPEKRGGGAGGGAVEPDDCLMCSG